MKRVVALDSGPLGLACGNPGRPEVSRFLIWSSTLISPDTILVIPEIADYEVRRGLLKAGSRDGVKRLDKLRESLVFVAITREAMRRAADLWAHVRRLGLPTAAEGALDGDAILAAQCLEFCGARDRLIVATEYVDHLSRFGVDARIWEAIAP